ncbi:MAG: hypothetical protein COW24_02355 [Candidatus Kerfeldbacteria bacterium CG15_BIG_FIL_POST_REV_8_21_14_020_45_12]|uniref:Inositol monophosphatase n=1 Tax=Candidatus Kerfeldbacteria bacterium CG15_BIG_FIL_POST_REV_8_21_14_020_45_12 TaxID=2014247 RepID=A0A2M7H475_9BACT|nr:MAG: hypothetical protein COW24_02355 [Candidatus Kerfeldbacteria bacterium CG15_BIG_FIL_POST_REV_8_21_14_020_45_12]PJA93563.1 MAG: hypothetical protein CO132_02395 [Candidatus Kerfeldbacteria bacterium CG_4_9_14_3_um_filter_45_8]
MSQQPQLTTEADFAVDLATQAGEILLSFYGKPLTRHIKKSEEGFATEADLASEAHILKAIKQHYPTDNILAEESGRVDHGSEYTWIVDPLDGTFNFANNQPEFGVLIARARDHIIELGVSFNPVSGQLGVAERGAGAWFNGQRVVIPQNIDGSFSPLVGYWPDASTAERLDKLRKLWQSRGMTTESLRSCAANILAMLRGDYDLYVGSDFCPWDYAALIVLAEEAGLIVSDFNELPIDWRNGDQNVFFAPANIHADILKTIMSL